MSMILKKSQYLINLFTDAKLTERLVIALNIEQTRYLLKTPSSKTRQLMAQQNVAIEDLLAENCLALTRFYLSDQCTQLAYFLNCERLALFFSALPMAEATIFQQHLIRATKKLNLPDTHLQASLVSEAAQPLCDYQDKQIKVGYQQLTYLQSLQNLYRSVLDKNQDYQHCFYQLQQSLDEKNNIKQSLTIHFEYFEGLLFYSELMPLMQLKAQHLFKKKCLKQRIVSL